MQRLLFFALCLLAAAAGTAPAAQEGDDGLSVAGRADRQRVTIGEPLTYELDFTLPSGRTLVVPERPETLGPWVVRDFSVGKSTAPGNARELRLTYTLAAFATGPMPVPEQTFRVKGDDGAETGITAAPVPVEVESVLARLGDRGDIMDLKAPMKVPRSWKDFLPLAAGIAATAAFAYLLSALLRRRRKKKDDAVPAAPPLPPYEEAMAALERLRAGTLLADGRIKEYYSALHDVLRAYAARVYGVETRDRTSAELRALLKSREEDRRLLADMKSFFDESDLVKFARCRPDADACRRAWEKAAGIVETKDRAVRAAASPSPERPR